MLYADICVAGAGIIGLSLALELHHRGARVIVVEAASPLQEASTAAAGMLAAEDPDNPPQLLALSRRSLALYPQFLRRIEQLGGLAVPLQTSLTLQQYEQPRTGRSTRSTIASIDDLDQQTPQPLIQPSFSQERFGIEERIARILAPGSVSRDRFQLLREHSIDPRQLAPAVLAAVRSTSIQLLTDSPLRSTRSLPTSVHIEAATTTIEAEHFIDCRGAWSCDPAAGPTTSATTEPAYSVLPVKGQMLAVVIPPELPLDLTLRTSHFYIVPRLHGPRAGRAIIGATVEHAGFDKAVHASDITALQAQAASLVPALANARVLETWAGLRPATADHLPLLGPHPTKAHHFVATGHYRNGILLAPATAEVMADLILRPSDSHPTNNRQTRESAPLDLSAFSPARFLKPRLGRG